MIRDNFQTTDDLMPLKVIVFSFYITWLKVLLAKYLMEIFDTINNKQIKYNELKLGLKNILLKTPNFQKIQRN